MSSLPSDEVAADYRDALEDLITNDRFSIANLTQIAKENIEHAQAIARTLTLHVKKAPPSRKLPALYVLDSLVKNIGSPYTVYFGSNLHETFMLAYSQVDQAVRRKLEELLKTWREPVAGSLSSTPVFPHNATQSIIDALGRFKAATAPRPSVQQIRPSSVQPSQYQPTPLPQQLPYVQTPQIQLRNPTPILQPIYPPQTYSQPSQTPVQDAPQPPQIQHQYPSYLQSNGGVIPNPGVDVRKLHSDIDSLTTDAKIGCMTNPLDQARAKKLETLQSLKAVLDSGALGEHDLRDVRETITKEMDKKNAENLAAQQYRPPQVPTLYQQPNIPTPYQQPPLQAPYQQPIYPPQYQQQTYTPAPYQRLEETQPQYSAPPQAPSLFGQTNLADLLRHAQQKSSTPTMQPVVPSISTPQPASIPASMGTLSLLDSLRASGALSKVTTPLQGTTPPMLPTSLDQLVPLNSAALKIPRPHLVLSFMNAKPNQCSTCGRRFSSDETGRAQKEKHLDWHFKTKTRSLEAEQRGQNRSWYVDEHEWIASKEYEDDLGLEDAIIVNGSPSTVIKKEQDFVRTPSDPVHRNAVCPIDQEPFKSEWSSDIQDFIWRDAVKVGDKYYHASCYREAVKSKDVVQTVRSSTPLGLGHRRTATPDSVLGKRKIEDDEPTSRSRVKTEG